MKQSGDNQDPMYRLFFREGSVAVHRVASREGEVAEAVEPSFLYSLPVGAKHRAPFGPEVFVLWHDVLDCERTRVDALIAEVLQGSRR